MASEPIHDIAHLGHVELLTPKFEESRRFFIDVMGMTQSGEKGDSVYLRGVTRSSSPPRNHPGSVTPRSGRAHLRHWSGERLH